MLRKFGIIAVLSLMALALAAVPALAVTNFENGPSGAHYRQGFAEPTCTPLPALTITCTPTQIAGVGNLGATETLTLDVTADVVCHNPGSKRKVVEPHSYSAPDTTGPIPLAPNRNGTLVVPQISGSTSASEIDAAFQCPNTNWEDEVTNVTVTGYTYTLTFNGFTEPFIEVTG